MLHKYFYFYSARFLFGGEQGRLKYAPPDQFSPIYECLLPTQTLCIDPGFYFGELHKVILSGPLPTEDDVAFVPNPVDTTNVGQNRYLILICSFICFYKLPLYFHMISRFNIKRFRYNCKLLSRILEIN